MHLTLDGSWQVHHCPLYAYGCQFAVERFLPFSPRSKVKLDPLHQSFTADPVEVLDLSAASQEGGSGYLAELQKKKELALFGYYRGEPMDPLSQLPSEVLVLVLQHLDSLSGSPWTLGARTRCPSPSMQVWYFTATVAFPDAWGQNGHGVGSMCAHMEQYPVLAATRRTYEDHTRIQLPVRDTTMHYLSYVVCTEACTVYTLNYSILHIYLYTIILKLAL